MTTRNLQDPLRESNEISTLKINLDISSLILVSNSINLE